LLALLENLFPVAVAVVRKPAPPFLFALLLLIVLLIPLIETPLPVLLSTVAPWKLLLLPTS
jgi:hypothetical protein